MNLIEIIKRAALDAVRESKPLEMMFAKVVQKEDIPNERPLLIQVEQKKPLTRAFFIENGKLDNLELNDKLVLLQVQGGQRFYILEVLGSDTD